MKPNPCKRCGKEPSRTRQGVHTIDYRCLDCDDITNRALNEWNAMNPILTDKCGPMPVDEAEFAKGIAKQADAIEKLRASDCPVESQEPIAIDEKRCWDCRFHWAGQCFRYPAVWTGSNWSHPRAEKACGEWRAK